jgi:hypothetical protein
MEALLFLAAAGNALIKRNETSEVSVNEKKREGRRGELRIYLIFYTSHLDTTVASVGI